MKKVLVVGGAGYIGSHMCKYLANNGMHPIILDNLSLGHHKAVQWGDFYQGNLDDTKLLHDIFSNHAIVAVIHFAALCYVGESMQFPLKYYQNNVSATLILIEAMLAHGVKKLIFSSTCATYGNPTSLPITEDHPQAPINPYGRSKLMLEQILEDLDHSNGLKTICLRYFNAAGADPEGTLGEDHRPETHLLPLVLQVALDQKKECSIFGNDYPTEDGTCVRDYIHVQDLAQAHFLAINYLNSENTSRNFNLGNKVGYSILEVIKTAQKITGKEISFRYKSRRPGDPAILVGSSDLITRELGWQPQFSSLQSILKSAWQWHKNNPQGFGA